MKNWQQRVGRRCAMMRGGMEWAALGSLLLVRAIIPWWRQTQSRSHFLYNPKVEKRAVHLCWDHCACLPNSTRFRQYQTCYYFGSLDKTEKKTPSAETEGVVFTHENFQYLLWFDPNIHILSDTNRCGMIIIDIRFGDHVICTTMDKENCCGIINQLLFDLLIQ
jgi:hypothetical protein